MDFRSDEQARMQSAQVVETVHPASLWDQHISSSPLWLRKYAQSETYGVHYDFPQPPSTEIDTAPAARQPSTAGDYSKQPSTAFRCNHQSFDVGMMRGGSVALDSRTDNLTPEYHSDTLGDVSDINSQSAVTNSTPSQARLSSSHTSVEPATSGQSSLHTKGLLVVLDGFSRKSPLSSQLSPAKSISPVIPQIVELPKAKRQKKSLKPSRFSFFDFRPRTSIPADIPHEELARQSVHAAYSSRLNPFTLHAGEYSLLKDHICQSHVTAYLNVRNRILRLWVRNPLVSVNAEEAAGCAYTTKWLGLAQVAYEWLVRRGYINFGCVVAAENIESKAKRISPKKKRKTIVVIGAGMAGLGAARQLESLFQHYRDRWTESGEEIPKVIVLEGRSRIGGRVYSHPLKQQTPNNLPAGLRCTAEMGGHIVTGFDHGNPLSMIIRGQLALPYHPLRDTSTLYDVDGQPVDRERDKLTEKLFNDILERASDFRYQRPAEKVIEGDQNYIEVGRDPTGEAGIPIGSVQSETPTRPSSKQKKSQPGQTKGAIDKLTGRSHLVNASGSKSLPFKAAMNMGWKVPHHDSVGISEHDFPLSQLAQRPGSTLGSALDIGVQGYQQMLGLEAQHLRLLNWHFANLEYANAANVENLSLRGHDQDTGNEFEGEHTQIIGGYQQVPRALWEHPQPLNVTTRKAVVHIAYDPDSQSSASCRMFCQDGSSYDATKVVFAAPLGVLKSQSVNFQPALPSWKSSAIRRLGFGLLNKVVLVFDKPFWDVDQDMVGLLRDSAQPHSTQQEHYVSNRGRFYLFWNCIKTSGRPVLIALMAGDAAHQAEQISDRVIVAEVTEQLRRMYKLAHPPQPSETIVTRWGRDEFAQGTYSYMAPESLPSDYDDMSKAIGNLHFAGEATCGTHPATVHGAYISGLRAASEIIDDLLGPIEIPDPLVPVTIKADPDASPSSSTTKPTRVTGVAAPVVLTKVQQDEARLNGFEADILKAILTKLGPRPSKPGNPGSNPFLLFSKDNLAAAKVQCDATRQASANPRNPTSKTQRNEVRAILGAMWRAAPEDVRRPYVERVRDNRLVNNDSAATFQDRLNAWDADAVGIRRDYVRDHPDVISEEEERRMWEALGVVRPGGITMQQERKAKRASGYAGIWGMLGPDE
ncbi:hypothetical protein MMC25_000240 [Agyrium rufum]|nr:hypothetical protein [Agyrium rufum]